MDGNKEKLIQLRVDAVSKDKAEKGLGRVGLTLYSALLSMIYSIAATGKTPFDEVFTPDKKQ